MSQCFRLGALPDCGSWALQLISNYQHMARTHSNPYSSTPFRALSRSNTHTHTCTFIRIGSAATVISGEKVLFSTQKSKLHFGASARMRTFCAAAFESNYHNYQLIKRRQRNAALMVLITMSSLGYWDEIKGTHPDKGSPYRGSRARRVRWETGEAFHLVPFVWLKIRNENKQRKSDIHNPV